MKKLIVTVIAGMSAAAFATSAAGQGTPAAPTLIPAASGPQVGQPAPDFSLPGSTRYGLLKNPIHLSDYRGSTVVLAFFYQARTKG